MTINAKVTFCNINRHKIKPGHTPKSLKLSASKAALDRASDVVDNGGPLVNRTPQERRERVAWSNMEDETTWNKFDHASA